MTTRFLLPRTVRSAKNSISNSSKLVRPSWCALMMMILKVMITTMMIIDGDDDDGDGDGDGD